MRSLIVLALLAIASPVHAGEAKPTLWCKFIQARYQHYHAQGYTIEQMKKYLAMMGTPQRIINTAEKCLG